MAPAAFIVVPVARRIAVAAKVITSMNMYRNVNSDPVQKKETWTFVVIVMNIPVTISMNL
jgi:hypothetical protein